MRRPIILSCALLAALVTVLLWPAGSERSTSPPDGATLAPDTGMRANDSDSRDARTRSSESETAGKPSRQAALTEYRNPVTGELESPPAGWTPPESPATRRSLSTSSRDLTERPSPTPGGGVVLPLEGRFRNHVAETTQENGEITTTCTDSGDVAAERAAAGKE